jgi:hypothetical protein
MIKQFFKKITGIQAIEDLRKEAETAAVEAVKAAAMAKAESDAAIAASIAETLRVKKEEEQAKLSPKDRATAQGIPYVAVLDTHVNKDNIRNGFFELDWNSFFIQELIKAGYGTESNPEEETVDRWFRDLARNILSEDGYGDNSAGSINVININDARK